MTDAPQSVDVAQLEPSAPVVLEHTGISVTVRNRSGMPSPEALDALTLDWRELKANDLEARGHERARDGQSPAWHYQRAECLRRGEERRQTDCGAVPLAGAACPCCRRGYRIGKTCGSRWCADCASRAELRTKKKLLRALTGAEKAAWASWRRGDAHKGHAPREKLRRPALRLLTLTGPHSGMLDVDRKRLVLAWKRMRAWLAKRGTEPYSFVVRHELAAGTDGKGHWHLHVAIFVPWVDWAAFRRAWCSAIEYEGAAPPDWGTGYAKRRRADGRPETPRVQDAAAYIAKYIAKPCSGLDVEVVARFYTASYAQRLTHASKGFWVPFAGCCGTNWHRVACDDWQKIDGAISAAVADVVAWDAQRGRAPPAVERRAVARLAAL